ncbi:hypothetical protein EVAR_41964_1 [Eumeta japonica]|uniref:Uncharacterized protein n=1 Tax=Eumeta variegata TaxID=151549 RepID=A0A4C1WPY4_EUMVA|nr:hypothetical protein EVAR_41964_1 [Eumeta japonica]
MKCDTRVANELLNQIAMYLQGHVESAVKDIAAAAATTGLAVVSPIGPAWVAYEPNPFIWEYSLWKFMFEPIYVLASAPVVHTRALKTFLVRTRPAASRLSVLYD